ncbi:MAG: hypothetical protein U0002_01095 [Thermoanaerobaculia bacterium]
MSSSVGAAACASSSNRAARLSVCEGEEPRRQGRRGAAGSASGLGRHHACFAELETSFAERSWYVSWLRTAPLLDPLREDRRFDDLLERCG